MKKACQLLFLFFISYFINSVAAASLTLQSIGSLNTSGKSYTEWWYTGTSPTLKGGAVSGKEVKVMVSDKEYKTTADNSGMWSVTITEGKGDYQVSITSEGESYTFTLHLGQMLPESVSGGTQVSESSPSVPKTGSNQLLGFALFTVLLGISFYYFFIVRFNERKAYIDSVLKSINKK